MLNKYPGNWKPGVPDEFVREAQPLYEQGGLIGAPVAGH